MKRRRARKRHYSGAPKWMVTYSDLVTLILVFFILLFSMSQIDEDKFEDVSASFRNRMILDFHSSMAPMEQPANEDAKKSGELERQTQQDTADNTGGHQDNLADHVKQFLQKNDLNDVVSANKTDQGIALVLQENILFETGKATIVDAGKPVLDKIGEMLSDLPNNVRVEGHTDDRPISSYKYPSNWELSGARASGVIRYWLDTYDFDESRFSSIGYGDTRPVVKNNSKVDWRQNRRVEIVIKENESSEKEGKKGDD
ncbi:flagellar motor protein MotS [Barrientosiimonas marina]|uniref:Flagellar motor protein MotS n=1 Tax=Lentibacillus kimchii TaxID=1542911 RepID=A0ABW2UWP1_9BACI